MSAFDVGNIVELNSGGPSMTVIERTPEGLLVCMWFAGCYPESKAFPEGALNGATASWTMPQP